jgi:hypothetical protein
MRRKKHLPFQFRRRVDGDLPGAVFEKHCGTRPHWEESCLSPTNPDLRTQFYVAKILKIPSQALSTAFSSCVNLIFVRLIQVVFANSNSILTHFNSPSFFFAASN